MKSKPENKGTLDQLEANGRQQLTMYYQQIQHLQAEIGKAEVAMQAVIGVMSWSTDQANEVLGVVVFTEKRKPESNKTKT